MNPLYIILGIAAIWYLPTLIGVLKLDVRIKTFIPVSITENSITFDVGLEMINNSPFRVDINAMNIDVLLNGNVIGTITRNMNIPILSGRAQVVPVSLQITPDNLGALLWQEAINKNLQNFVFELNGTLRANGKPFPFRSTWTIKDFTNLIGIGSVPKRGMSDSFLIRRQKAISELFDLQKSEEFKPMSFSTVERKVFYDKQRDTFRLIGKSYDYTSTF